MAFCTVVYYIGVWRFWFYDNWTRSGYKETWEVVIHHYNRLNWGKTTFSTCYCPVRGTSPASAYSWQPYKYITMNNNKGPATKRIGKIPVWILIVVIFVSVWPYLVDHITTCIFYQWSMLCMFFCCVAWNAYTSRRIASNNSFYFWVAAPRVTFFLYLNIEHHSNHTTILISY